MVNGPSVAVIGAGIFGVTSAIKLRRSGCRVDLIEKQKDILTAASHINQHRLHRGYHYPRSVETARECVRSQADFLAEYGNSVVDQYAHYYCIAATESKTSPESYKLFCDELELEAEVTSIDVLREDNISLCIKAKESLFDSDVLRHICWSKLKSTKVRVLLQVDASDVDLSVYDYVVVCTYINNNKFLQDRLETQRYYQYELCEKPVVRLPPSFRNKSVVIMDGPFMCIDPLPKSDMHLLGNVVHAIHETTVDLSPMTEEKYDSLLNKRTVKNPSITNFDRFISTGTYFFNEFEKLEYVGSMYTIRAVLPNVDDTDERPSLVRSIDDRVIEVFSGKIATCVSTADQVVDLVMPVN